MSDLPETLSPSYTHVCLYQQDSSDAFGAAWVVHHTFGKSTTLMVPMDAALTLSHCGFLDDMSGLTFIVIGYDEHMVLAKTDRCLQKNHVIFLQLSKNVPSMGALDDLRVMPQWDQMPNWKLTPLSRESGGPRIARIDRKWHWMQLPRFNSLTDLAWDFFCGMTRKPTFLLHTAGLNVCLLRLHTPMTTAVSEVIGVVDIYDFNRWDRLAKIEPEVVDQEISHRYCESPTDRDDDVSDPQPVSITQDEIERPTATTNKNVGDHISTLLRSVYAEIPKVQNPQEVLIPVGSNIGRGMTVPNRCVLPFIQTWQIGLDVIVIAPKVKIRIGGLMVPVISVPYDIDRFIGAKLAGVRGVFGWCWDMKDNRQFKLWSGTQHPTFNAGRIARTWYGADVEDADYAEFTMSHGWSGDL